MVRSAREPAAASVETTPDGWTVDDSRIFRLIMGHSPPRPWGHLNQVGIDIWYWPTIRIWLIGITFLILGLATNYRLFLLPGVYAFARWYRIAQISVHSVRSSPVAKGVIDKLEPHPLVRTCATAMAATPDGRRRPVVLERAIVGETIADGGRAEVLFLDDPRCQYSSVIAARPAPPSEFPRVLSPWHPGDAKGPS
jgi:hypothetical protein